MRITLDFFAVAWWSGACCSRGRLDAFPHRHVGAGRAGGRRGLCLGARQGPRWLGLLAATYVELIRNTPFIVQLFFVFFGLPAAGVRLSPEAASVIAMVINLGAYAAEIIRAGIEATPRGQIGAALSLALSRLQVFIRVALHRRCARCGRRWSARSSS